MIFVALQISVALVEKNLISYGTAELTALVYGPVAMSHVSYLYTTDVPYT